MTPAYLIKAHGSDITETLSQFAATITITDNSEDESDTLDIELSALASSRISPIKKGVILQVWLGYEETGLVEFGEFEVDEVEASGPPTKYRVRASAAHLGTDINTPKTRSFSKTTLGAILATLASDHGLESRVHADFSALSIEHLNQTSSSDLALLYRLAGEYGALGKISGRYLVFTKFGAGQSASGQPLDAIEIRQRDCTRWSWRDTEREKSASTKSYKPDSETISTESSDAQSVYHNKALAVSRHPHRSPGDFGKASVKRSEKAGTKINLTCEGNPSIRAEAPIHLDSKEWPLLEITGRWYVTRAEHKLDDAGHLTIIEADRGDIKSAKEKTASNQASRPDETTRTDADESADEETTRMIYYNDGEYRYVDNDEIASRP